MLAASVIRSSSPAPVSGPTSATSKTGVVEPSLARELAASCRQRSATPAATSMAATATSAMKGHASFGIERLGRRRDRGCPLVRSTQDVAHAAHGLQDPRLVRIFLDLRPEPVDVNIDRPRFAGVIG